MANILRNLLEDLTQALPEGSPAIIMVDDYGERQSLVDSLVDESAIHGIEAVVVRSPAEMMARLPALSAEQGQAALILIDAHAAETFGPWLDASREKLPLWVRFVIVLMMRQDFPALATTAPAFMSWAKDLVLDRVPPPGSLSSDDVGDELDRMRREVGMSPREFVDAWQKGELPDTFRNTTWLNLAWASLQERP